MKKQNNKVLKNNWKTQGPTYFFSFLWYIMDFSFARAILSIAGYNTELRTKGLWFMNHESVSWSHEPKIRRTSNVHESFFPKCDIFKIIGVGDMSVYLSGVKWMKLTDKRKNSVNFFGLFNIYACFISIWCNIAL